MSDGEESGGEGEEKQMNGEEEEKKEEEERASPSPSPSRHRTDRRSSSAESRSRSPRRRHRRNSGDEQRRTRGKRRSTSRSSASRSRRDRSRSPMSSRRRHFGSRDDPEPTRCLGIFGMSLYTNERDLKEYFGQFGPLESVQIVYDHPTGRSRGFGFVYFENTEDAIEAKERATGMELDGHKVRIDFSITKRAHTPTPGIYMGQAHERRMRGGGDRGYFNGSGSGGGDRGYYNGGDRGSSGGGGYRGSRGDRYGDRYGGGYRRSPSPRGGYDDRRSRRRSRSYDRDYY